MRRLTLLWVMLLCVDIRSQSQRWKKGKVHLSFNSIVTRAPIEVDRRMYIPDIGSYQNLKIFHVKSAQNLSADLQVRTLSLAVASVEIPTIKDVAKKNSSNQLEKTNYNEKNNSKQKRFEMDTNSFNKEENTLVKIKEETDSNQNVKNISSYPKESTSYRRHLRHRRWKRKFRRKRQKSHLKESNFNSNMEGSNSNFEGSNFNLERSNSNFESSNFDSSNFDSSNFESSNFESSNFESSNSNLERSNSNFESSNSNVGNVREVPSNSVKNNEMNDNSGDTSFKTRDSYPQNPNSIDTSSSESSSDSRGADIDRQNTPNPSPDSTKDSNDSSNGKKPYPILNLPVEDVETNSGSTDSHTAQGRQGKTSVTLVLVILLSFAVGTIFFIIIGFTVLSRRRRHSFPIMEEVKRAPDPEERVYDITAMAQAFLAQSELARRLNSDLVSNDRALDMMEVDMFINLTPTNQTPSMLSGNREWGSYCEI